VPTDPILAAGGFGEVARRLVVAMLIGCALGINRDLRNKPAGLRTHALVSLGSALIVVTSIVLAHAVTPPDAGSVLRVVQGVITGIGFLGGGVILRDRETQSVTGLTTAATIWISACLGLTCGAGQWQLALLAVAITLVVLIFGGPVEQAVYARLRPGGEAAHRTVRTPGRRATDRARD
jgi:putative Mg2+ transporter-C (MgtC) family protein